MGRTREYAARTICSFSIESELLRKLDEVAEREKKERSQILQELISSLVQRKILNPNPQTTLDVRAYPNPWTDDDSAWGLDDYSADQLHEMLKFIEPKTEMIRQHLAKYAPSPAESPEEAGKRGEQRRRIEELDEAYRRWQAKGTRL